MSEELDLSKAVEQVKAMLSSEEGENTLQGILGMLSGGQAEDNPAVSDSENPEKAPAAEENDVSQLFSGLGDIENIMKIKNILSVVGNQRSDSNVAFLQALRPFLSSERQTKLDSAAKILNVTRAFKVLKDSGLGGV